MEKEVRTPAMDVAIKNQFGCVDLSGGGSVPKVCHFLGSGGCEVPTGEDFFDHLPDLLEHCHIAGVVDGIENKEVGRTGGPASVGVILSAVREEVGAINEVFAGGNNL